LDKKKLLFNKEYEEFYQMVEENEVFSKYCEEVYGIDFSQDGFSDIKQINEMLIFSGIKSGYQVLEIGCGNGKLAEYISEKTGATVYGFDYSENAIKSAKQRTVDKEKLKFEEGIIGEKEYAPESFDVIISVDAICYSVDMETFVQQLCSWLKPNGLFLCFYSEGQINSCSRDEDSSELAMALKSLNISYVVVDFTLKHYELLKHKREIIKKYEKEFMDKNMNFYYQCAINTSIDPDLTFDEFKKQNNRYLYIVRKEADIKTLEDEKTDTVNKKDIVLSAAQNAMDETIDSEQNVASANLNNEQELKKESTVIPDKNRKGIFPFFRL
jgi:Cyclopropane fatty acid synthase and related methyltransferases